MTHNRYFPASQDSCEGRTGNASLWVLEGGESTFSFASTAATAVQRLFYSVAGASERFKTDVRIEPSQVAALQWWVWGSIGGSEFRCSAEAIAQIQALHPFPPPTGCHTEKIRHQQCYQNMALIFPSSGGLFAASVWQPSSPWTEISSLLLCHWPRL